MITLPHPARQAPLWQHELRQAITRPGDLLNFLQIDPEYPPLAADKVRDFPLRVPLGFARRMRKGDPNDPLFLQVWPAPAEARTDVPGFTLDAVGDRERLRPGGLIHKYDGRALLIATGACGIHCRYCFRRHFPYSDSLATREHWRGALQTIREDESLREIILSGGDPLSLVDEKLAELSDALNDIPHVIRLRIHTRQPVVLPSRVDHALLDWLARSRLQKVMVLHVNHARELDDDVQEACRRLQGAGVMLLNQAVLLKNINDDADSLVSLSERLSACGVLPYYLHQIDRVQGAAHFEVTDEDARRLMKQLSERLPGFLVPRLAREVAGAPAKEVLSW